MMDWLQSVDVALVRLINRDLSNPVCDGLVWLIAQKWLLVPLLVAGIGALAWRRQWRFILALVLVLATGDALVYGPLKKAFGRSRPFVTMPEVNPLAGKGRSGSMPSSHAGNWFAAAAVCGWFWRRSLRVGIPAAAMVSFARVYGGVHYPSDVLVGAVLGAGWGMLGAWAVSKVRVEGRRWDWLQAGYVVLGVVLVARLLFAAFGPYELSEDEAYQWVWSKHLALSYYSKPPLIAYSHWLSTRIAGDTTFGVRMFSPLIAAGLGLLWLRFLARNASARAGFWFVGVCLAAPLLAVGATLMTIDVLSVLFWSLALFAGWRALQSERTADWCWCGLWLGLGFLSKYIALFQLASFALVFALHAPARRQLRRPGPWLALGIVALSTLPVVIWNAQHGWVTMQHLSERGGLDKGWTLTLRYIKDFVGAEAGLLNPVFFGAIIWAAVALWRSKPGNLLLRYLFAMGAPLFLFYLVYSLRARVLANWIAPTLLPLFALMVVYWEQRYGEGQRRVRGWLVAGMVMGALVVIPLHNTRVISAVSGWQLPVAADPTRRVRGWRETAKLVAAARAEHDAQFVIGGHYGITSLMAFYERQAPAFCLPTPRPQNQYYFWPGYEGRKGQNAIFVTKGEGAAEGVVPAILQQQFESVTDLGVQSVVVRGRELRRVRLYACRGLR